MSSHATALSSPSKPEGQVAVARAKYTRRRARGWETTKLFLRSLSLTLFLGIFITNMTYLPIGNTNSALDEIWPWMTIAAAGPALLWDVADLLTLWVRRGRAIAPKAQIGIELVLALGAGVGAGLVGWQLTMTAAGFSSADPGARAEGVLGTLFTFMMLLLGARLVLFFRACVDRRRELRTRRPRIMYIEALGQAVFVVAKPNVGFGRLAVGGGGGGRDRSATGDSTKQTAASVTSGTARDTDSFAGTEAQTDVTSMTTLVPGPSQAASITARQRPLMRPPPEGYEPDEAELERRRRGDAQPQFMVAEVVDMKFSSNVVVNPQEGKFLVESSRSPGVAGESSRSQLRSAPMGETRADRPRSWG
ncbi:hypothetical protein D7B24_004924 [Verticillium nonalfalfae]|uniref:Uncharacterized protein n=1 Tax=Verticillium nonalfalfae TaxID=1051616 RepID=A0A3M9YD09_9PEZI|nr:uncharacterized protein D7B24_004924 [Verticillium nonalfalfae]RNJ58284.1 hypothetical protein D7B24_004924 [Verticillium nonalfalfae]